MSSSKETEGSGAPAGAPQGASGGASQGASGGGPQGSAALTSEDLSAAYNLGLRNNNELTQQLLIDQVQTLNPKP